MKKTVLGSVFAGVVAAAALVVAPGEAAAQVRINGLAGVAHLNSPRAQAPSLVGTVRGEASFGFLPWLHLGGYGELMQDLSTGTAGSNFGGQLSLRPGIPLSPIDPMAFASIGYLRYPVGDGQLSGGWNGQLGVGLVIHAGSFIDIEGRAAMVRMVSRDEASLDAGGYTISGGVSLHL